MTDREWRADIDALEFTSPNGEPCFVHRLAFRCMLDETPTPRLCLAFFDERRAAFLEASGRQLDSVSVVAPFHLNSRQLRRALGLL